jgi:propanol-preferring alcohol dehydrogenase
MMGYTIDGAFGEYAAVDARYVIKVPDCLDSFDAVPLTCAGVTTYKAVKVAGTRFSDVVAAFGVGGLGHLAIWRLGAVNPQSRLPRSPAM